uniref:Uncharacterized protein n=1 Tax=Anguilla anguilla TaxID=7936 RepID=A0A0E9XBP7_ANGAN
MSGYIYTNIIPREILI